MAGTKYERELVNAFTELGWGAIRTPTSGSATDRDLPDLIVGEPMQDWEHHTGRPASFPRAIELKATSSTTAYVKGFEVDDLRRFAKSFGATPLIGARFKHAGKRNPFYLLEPGEARHTDEGNFGIPEADAEERAAMIVYSATENEPPRVIL